MHDSPGAVPVVVVPGGPCRDPAYLGDLAGLARTRPLVILHPRGTPASGGLSRGWWTDADDLIQVADHLEAPAVDVIAHSAGTRLALAAAAQHPGRIRSLALVTPAAAWLTGTPHDGAALAAHRSEPEITRAFASMNGESPGDETTFQRALEAEAAAGYARWTPVERQHAGVGAMTWAASSAWFRDIPADAAARITASPLPPTFVLGGRDDLLSGVAPVRAYADALGAHLTLLDDCGHYPWIEQPAAFRAALGDWLARVSQ
ncbi:alpha/beta hydrolase [Microbacterium lushaniae]|uniref:Alpha/beta hydrolase n=1 Tax=Microbacterium lushaniae TaxID=2614639 RepID=A0A5J6L8L1_9MICO|nr:alpha/beta hydrolase [Microbacterium lushaniae]